MLQLPRFQSYEEEAAFWDNLDTTDHMEDDGEWFRFEVAQPRETWSLGENPEFLAVLQRSWDRLHAEGPVPLAEAWRRLVAGE